MDEDLKGGCVATVFVAVAFAAVFAASRDLCVLLVWGVGVALLWRSVDKDCSTSTTPPSPEVTTPPPPEVTAPSEDVYAGDTGGVDRIEKGPEGVMFTVHPKRTEVPRRD